MKLQILGLSILLSASSFCFAMEKKDGMLATIRMPSAQVLAERFNDIGYHNEYLSETDVLRFLADQERNVSDVVMIVEASIFYYSAILPQSKQNVSLLQEMRKRKPSLCEALLKDSPEALRELRTCDLINVTVNWNFQ